MDHERDAHRTIADRLRMDIAEQKEKMNEAVKKSESYKEETEKIKQDLRAQLQRRLQQNEVNDTESVVRELAAQKEKTRIVEQELEEQKKKTQDLKDVAAKLMERF